MQKRFGYPYYQKYLRLIVSNDLTYLTETYPYISNLKYLNPSKIPSA
jgi:hypothetical protein